MVQQLRPWRTVIVLNFDCERPVYRQISDRIIEEIKKGRLVPGTPLPGTRKLAEDLKVNRKTIILSFDELLAEGWLVSIYKKGTFVSERLPQQVTVYRRNKKEPATSNFSFKQIFPIAEPFIVKGNNIIAFDDGLPDVRLAPMNELVSSYKRIFQQRTRWRMMGYGDPRGTETIRTAIAKMLLHERGLNADKERLCITRGSQMALFLTANTILEKGDKVAIEDPGYAPAWNTFRQCGAKLIPVAVDHQGICADSLEKLCRKTFIKAIYVTPHHQFPTTVSMKIDRRLKLIELSNKFGFAIIEDDYDHEFHFISKSLLPIASYENAANVIYIGSLSKIVAPAVRLGYISAPIPFINAIASLRKGIDVQGDNVMEHAIAELMEQGAIRKHARRAYKVYEARRENMNNKLSQYLGDKVQFQQPDGGLAYWVQLNQPTNTRKLSDKLMQKAVSVIPTESFSFRGQPLNALRLGFASLTPEELERGLKTIQKLL
jgi:GntR family transcriptional regulator/MocR family aminotransferase